MRHAVRATSDWQAVLAASRRWEPTAQRMLVIVPHPDDEAVMFGGLIATTAGHGGTVDVVAVTDGEAAYPDRVPPDRLAALRRSEQAASAEALGLPPSSIIRLGIPDGDIAGNEVVLADAIVARLGVGDIDLVVAPWEHDHHADHEACGRAVRRAIARCGGRVTAAFGLFWALLREEPPPDLVLHAIDLSTTDLHRKRCAIDRHASQITSCVASPPVLGVDELEITRWTREHYVVATP